MNQPRQPGTQWFGDECTSLIHTIAADCRGDSIRVTLAMTDRDDLHCLCDEEPIRIPGAIQPHGALLVLSAQLHVTGASENCAEVFGVEVGAMLGMPVARLFTGAGHLKLLDAIGRCRATGQLVEQLVLQANGHYLDCHLHATGDEIILDAEPWDPASDEFRHLIHGAVSGLDDLHQCFALR